MGINIKEKDGNIVFSNKQNYTQEGLLKKYRNDTMQKRVIKSQVDKLPQKVKEEKGNIEITNLQIENIQNRINQSEQIFKKKEIEPTKLLKKIREEYCLEYDDLSNEEKEKLKKLDEPIKDREQYADRELTKKSQIIAEKRTFVIKDKGQQIERTTKNTISPKDEVILYASNQYYLMQAQESLAKQHKNIERINIRLDANKDELEIVENSMHSIEQYFKKKRLNLDKLLDEQAINREKGKKEAQEINLAKLEEKKKRLEEEMKKDKKGKKEAGEIPLK